MKMILLLYGYFSQQELTKNYLWGVSITKNVSNGMYLALKKFHYPKLSENLLLTRCFVKTLDFTVVYTYNIARNLRTELSYNIVEFSESGSLNIYLSLHRKHNALFASSIQKLE
jgi:hypothetical protein